MAFWNSSSGDPLSLSLAADARFSNPDYVDDQIWKLSLSGGEPPALALQTTFGLRARVMRVFPRFVRASQVVSDPVTFVQIPRVEQVLPNYISVSCVPFGGVKATFDLWCPDSHAVAGQIRLHNQSVLKESFQLELVGLLIPLGEGLGMTIKQMGVNSILEGRTAELYPVCFLTGGPSGSSGPYPALTLAVDLYPGNEAVYSWAVASKSDPEESFTLARQLTARTWDAETTRIELQNESDAIAVETGDPNWDAVFALSQKVAGNLFFPAGPHLPEPSFVLNREPEQGYSIRGDGTDYPYLWNGQTVFDAYLLADQLLPGRADWLKGVVENFLAVQAEDGSIDWKPGLGGQRSGRLAQPMLAALACKIAASSSNGEQDWLDSIYPGLLRFLQVWFSPAHDRDQDGFPEWDHPVQSGLEDIPLLDRWQPGAQGVTVTSLETPALIAMLYQECQCLLPVARRLGRTDEAARLEQQAQRLCQNLASTWSDATHSYHYRDRDSHQTRPAEHLLEFSAPGRYPLGRNWRTPRRLVLHLEADQHSTLAIQVTFHGKTAEGEVDEVTTTRQMYWSNNHGRITSEHTFFRLDYVEIQAQSALQRGWLTTIDYTQEDVSLLLPLWAGMPDSETAQSMVEACLLPGYFKPYGVPICRKNQQEASQPALNSIHMFWNLMVGEGLLRYGYRSAAADLISRLMKAAILSLKEQQSFRAAYHAESGAGMGEANLLRGLPPLGLFLQALGLRKISAAEVVLDGLNPFPWPITVKYRGIRVQFQWKESTVTFPTGQSIQVIGPGPHTVTLR